MKGSNSILLDSIPSHHANFYESSLSLASFGFMTNLQKLTSYQVHLHWKLLAGQFLITWRNLVSSFKSLVSTTSSKRTSLPNQVTISTVLFTDRCPVNKTTAYPLASIKASSIITFALQALSILDMSKTSFSLTRSSTSQGSKCL